jgi:hypothetical protein
VHNALKASDFLTPRRIIAGADSREALTGVKTMR